MARKKRQSIHAIQEALRGNTSFIGGEGEGEATPEVREVEVVREVPVEVVKEVEVVREVEVIREVEVPVAVSGLVLDEARSEKLRILADYQRVTPEQLLVLAVDDLLDLRRRQLKAAMEQRGE